MLCFIKSFVNLFHTVNWNARNINFQFATIDTHKQKLPKAKTVFEAVLFIVNQSLIFCIQLIQKYKIQSDEESIPYIRNVINVITSIDFHFTNSIILHYVNLYNDVTLTLKFREMSYQETMMKLSPLQQKMIWKSSMCCVRQQILYYWPCCWN